MQIIRKENGSFETVYPEGSPVVRCISDKTECTLTFELASGEKRCFPFPKWFESVYNRQFGISVSKDGKRFFVQSWTKGLFCYSIDNCELLWHFKRKHARNIILDNEKFVCFFKNWGAASISVFDGTLIDRYPLSTELGICRIICENYMLLGPKRGAYIILDASLRGLYLIPCSVLNPGHFSSFLIQKAELYDGVLTIDGIERSYGEPVLDNGEKNRFKRSIRLDRFIISNE
ncbi:MAG: hypothetical protein IJM20_05220 [Clostridia bacterium]|nr:hypothetical protein [Clostridia bacterium]